MHRFNPQRVFEMLSKSLQITIPKKDQSDSQFDDLANQYETTYLYHKSCIKLENQPSKKVQHMTTSQ